MKKFLPFIVLGILLFFIGGLLWLYLQPKERLQDIFFKQSEEPSVPSCPPLPEGYKVREKLSLGEYSKEEKVPWGNFAHMVMGHLEKGAITPNIVVTPGKYAFFAEIPQKGKERKLIFLGYTTNPQNWLQCYDPQAKGGLTLTVFDIPPKELDLKETNLDGYGGIRGWVILSLEKI